MSRSSGKKEDKGKSQVMANLEDACRALFEAYDIDESGEISRAEFIKIEMRVCFEKGEVFDENAEVSKLTIADSDNSGTIDYNEFRNRNMRQLTEMGLSNEAIVERLKENTQLALNERKKMGPRFHAGIRQCLKRIFTLYDVSGDGALSPEEWISAQKVVALELSDDLDESWIDEGAFSAADANNDGAIQLEEYLEANFQMFEGVKTRTEQILVILQKVMKAMEARKTCKETMPVTILVQASEKPEFQPPHDAWQDEPTEEQQDKNANAWTAAGEIVMPCNLEKVDEVASLIRLHLKKSEDTWVSMYYRSGQLSQGNPITMFRNQNVRDTLEYFTKANACREIFLKNIRAAPKRLQLRQQAWGDEREALLKKRVGKCWGFDWETQLVGDGAKLPYMPLKVGQGDAIVVEVPATDDNGQFTYITQTYMDAPEILGGPVEEVIEPKKPKKKKKKGGDAPEPDPMIQYSFIGMKPGSCVLFVDVSWDLQEELLAKKYKLTAPVAENSVARIGPIQVEVESSAGEKDCFEWWNGEKWSKKKGPAKKKGKKK